MSSKFNIAPYIAYLKWIMLLAILLTIVGVAYNVKDSIFGSVTNNLEVENNTLKIQLAIKIDTEKRLKQYVAKLQKKAETDAKLIDELENMNRSSDAQTEELIDELKVKLAKYKKVKHKKTYKRTATVKQSKKNNSNVLNEHIKTNLEMLHKAYYIAKGQDANITI